MDIKINDYDEQPDDSDKDVAKIEDAFAAVEIEVEEVKEAEKLVKVWPMKTWSCSVAGRWYYFEKDVPTEIPVWVEKELRRDINKFRM